MAVYPKRGVSIWVWSLNAVFVFPQWSWRCDVWRRNIRSDRLPVSPSNWNRWWCVTHTVTRLQKIRKLAEHSENGPPQIFGKVRTMKIFPDAHGIFTFYFLFLFFMGNFFQWRCASRGQGVAVKYLKYEQSDLKVADLMRTITTLTPSSIYRTCYNCGQIDMDWEYDNILCHMSRTFTEQCKAVHKQNSNWTVNSSLIRSVSYLMQW